MSIVVKCFYHGASNNYEIVRELTLSGIDISLVVSNNPLEKKGGKV